MDAGQGQTRRSLGQRLMEFGASQVQWHCRVQEVQGIRTCESKRKEGFGAKGERSCSVVLREASEDL